MNTSGMALPQRFLGRIVNAILSSGEHNQKVFRAVIALLIRSDLHCRAGEGHALLGETVAE